ncbi:hypothetical protein WG947_05460 [Pontibacter sp. H259]
MKLYLKMAAVSVIISLVFSTCERMGQSNLKLDQQVITSRPAIK